MEGDEGGEGIDERRCGYLRMRMIQRWTWSSRVRRWSKVVHWRVWRGRGGGGGGGREGEWAYCLEEEGLWVACIMR